MSSSRVVLYSLLATGLAAAFYFNSNADTIYAQLGNRYYKQNNIKKAQEFYEKSFALGNKDTGIREIYVNSIINSPQAGRGQHPGCSLNKGKVFFI